jgi:hypothetical protein
MGSFLFIQYNQTAAIVPYLIEGTKLYQIPHTMPYERLYAAIDMIVTAEANTR